MECSIDDCRNQKKYQSTGWCQTHYFRYWRTGSTELNPNRKEKVSYRGAHARVRSVKGPASNYECFKCKGPALQWAYQGGDPAEQWDARISCAYSSSPEFYEPMCRACHSRMDGEARSSKRQTCNRGHKWVEENIYRPPNKGPECRRCKQETSRIRYEEKKKQQEETT